MSDVSPGPGWWQASDLKWYPPEEHADYVAPLPPPAELPPPPTPVTPTQPPVTTKGPSGLVWFVLAGLALLAIAAFLLVGNPTQRGVLIAAVAIVIVGVWIADRSGQFAARTVMFVMAGLVAIAVLVVANYPYLYKAYCTNTPTCRYYGPLSSPSSSSPDSQSQSPSSAPSTSSPSYQQGLKSGTDGYAEVQAFGPYMGVALPYDQACQLSFNIDQGADPDLVQQDYIQGCLYGLNHQSAQWTQTRKTS